MITVGSSAGGYAAILYGSWLGAERIFSFNAQFELNSLLEYNAAEKNPILYRNQNQSDIRKYYDIVPMISSPTVYYFMSENCQWDSKQLRHLGDNPNVCIIRFKSSHHGVPFPRVALNRIMVASDETLNALNGKSFNPILFSVKFAGVRKTLFEILKQTIKIIKKRIRK